MIHIFCILYAFIASSQGFCQKTLNEFSCDNTVNQLLVVSCRSKNPSAQVSYYIRNGKGDFELFRSGEGFFGKNGLGKTVEGDGKTPCGCYAVTTAFGILPDPGTKLDYVSVTKGVIACDEDSQWYNKIVDTTVAGQKCNGEDMFSFSPEYDYGLALDYNKECVFPRGSAIFVHCKGKRAFTAGCVAIDKDFLKDVLIHADSSLRVCIGSSEDVESVDWQADWIQAPWHASEAAADEADAAPEFMRKFVLQKRIRSAVAHVTGLGFFELYLNGEKVGDDVLSPNETSYSHRPGLGEYTIALDDTNWRSFRVPYLTYDVKKYLKRGENSVSALVGNGFFAHKSGWMDSYGKPRFICQIEISYTDGSRELISSGSDWKVRRSPIVLNDMFLGEIYDSRMSHDETWYDVVIASAPDGALYEQDGPSDKVIEVLKPKSVTKLEDGSWEVDFGDYVTGWVRLKNFVLAKDSVISVKCPNEIPEKIEYKYIGNGETVKSYAPRFAWWVFSKAVVSGWPGEMDASDIVAEVVHSDVPECAEFECSNELFNAINKIWKRTQTDNMHLGVATDCPHREKGPYTGDGEAACVAVLHNFDASSFYRKWLRDMAGCQDTVTGYVPNGAPWHPGCGGGVAWGAAMCIIPWEYYLHYGDREVLEENYLPMTEEVRYLTGWLLDDGTMCQQKLGKDGKPLYWFNLGEWCPSFSLPSENLVHTWFLWRCADYTAKAAGALGRVDDYAYYRELANKTAEAFHKKFYDPASGSYDGGDGIGSGLGYGTGTGGGKGDGSNIFALAMGVPDSCRVRVIEAVRREIAENDGHLNTGIFGTGLFFEVLCDNGLQEEAYNAMNKRDFPSFGYMVESGSKTFWEQWNGEYSRNHPMFGGGLVWLYRKICGVQTDENEPGYRHAILKPIPCGDLTWARYSTKTVYGELKSSWKIRNGRFIYRIRVPEGCRATVYLPDGSEPVEKGTGKHRLSCRYQSFL